MSASAVFKSASSAMIAAWLEPPARRPRWANAAAGVFHLTFGNLGMTTPLALSSLSFLTSSATSCHEVAHADDVLNFWAEKEFIKGGHTACTAAKQQRKGERGGQGKREPTCDAHYADGPSS